MFRVYVDDNFHYQDETERYEHGVYATEAEALSACKEIVRASLNQAYKIGMTADELYDCYVLGGDDPWIKSEDPTKQISFLAWDYAKSLSVILANGGGSIR